MDRYQDQSRGHHNRQHQRFSWQSPPETPPEETNQPVLTPVQESGQTQQTARLDTTADPRHNRVFSYAQTPSEHLAFHFVPSPSDPVPPLPQSPPTPIDPRPQSMLAPHDFTRTTPQNTTAPQASYSLPAYDEKPPISPLSPHHYPGTLPLSPVSPIPPVTPVAEPPRIYTQAPPQQTQHARNLSNLSPLNTNVGVYHLPPIPPTPPSHNTQTETMSHNMPTTPSSIKKDPADFQLSPNSHRSYAHEAYSPHNLSTTTNGRHAVFSPDSAHGPNGLDFALHQPGQVSHPNMDHSSPGTTHAWNHSLCSCTGDFSSCLTGFFCPCVLYGRTSYRLSQKNAKQDPTDLLSYKATNGHCMMMAVTCGLWWLYPMVQRTRLRHAYKLEGGILGDCVRGACCCCCVAVQNEREIKSREEAKRQRAGPVSSQAYKSPGQMKYVPQ